MSGTGSGSRRAPGSGSSARRSRRPRTGRCQRRPARERDAERHARPRSRCRPTSRPAAGARQVARRISSVTARPPRGARARRHRRSSRTSSGGRATRARGPRRRRPRDRRCASPRRRSWVTKSAVRRWRCWSAAELALQLGARHRIEGAEGLVEQHERRVGRERARHADALALSAGQLVRPAAAVLARAAGRPATSISSTRARTRVALPAPRSRARWRRSRAMVRCGKSPISWIT